MGEAMLEKVARAMKQRASEPVANLPHVENVLVGSLGDAWKYLARAAIEAMREPTEEMLADPGDADQIDHPDQHNTNARRIWENMIDAILSPPATEGRNG